MSNLSSDPIVFNTIFSMTLKDSIWKEDILNTNATTNTRIWNDDILSNANAKTNTLWFCTQMKCKWENLKLKKLLMFEDLTWNLSPQNKTFTRNPQTLEKLSCTNLKFGLKLVGLAKNSLWHTWNLNLSTTWRILFHSLSQTSTLKTSKTWRTLFHTFELKTWNLKTLKNTLPHLRTYNTLKKSLPHLPLTWKSCKLLVGHHFEKNSHSPCKLRTLSQKDSLLFSMQYKLKTFHYFLF